MRAMARRDIRTLRDSAATAAAEGKYRKALECYLELEQLEPGEPNWPKRAAEVYRRLNKNREAIAAYDRAADRYVQGGFLVQAIAVCKIVLQIDPAHEQTKQRLGAITEQQDSTRTQAGALADRHRSLHGVPTVDALREPPPAPPRPAAGSEPPPVRSEAAIVVAPLVTLDDGATMDELSFDEGLPPEPPPVERAPDTHTGKRKPISGPILLDVGAPLDSVVLADAMPGAHHQLRDDGSNSGIIVIPIDDDPADEAGEMPSVEIETLSVGPEIDGGPELQLDPTEDPVELAVEDLEEIPDLAEPRAYSAAARRALTATPLFAGMPPAAMEQLIDRLALVELGDGEVLFRQGDPGETLFVVVDGGVIVVSEGPPRQELTRMGPGAFFGEVALVTEEPRSATIVADGATQLLAIGRDAIRALIGTYPDVLPVILRFLRDRLVDRLVKTHPLFASFAEHDREYLVAHFRFLEIEAGTVIIAQGARATGLYALLAGRVDVLDATRHVAHLRPGDLFGEGSLLTGAPSPHSVTATTRCLALCLPAPDFREIIMTHPQVLSYIGDLVDEREKLLASSVPLL